MEVALEGVGPGQGLIFAAELPQNPDSQESSLNAELVILEAPVENSSRISQTCPAVISIFPIFSADDIGLVSTLSP